MSLVLKLRCSIRDLHITCPGTKASLQKLGHTAKMAAMLVFVQIELELWLLWQHIRFNGKKKKKKKKKKRRKKKKILFSKTTRPTASIFSMWQWLMVIYIIYANHSPGDKFGHASVVDSLHIPTIGKHSNINISKNSKK